MVIYFFRSMPYTAYTLVRKPRMTKFCIQFLHSITRKIVYFSIANVKIVYFSLANLWVYPVFAFNRRAPLQLPLRFAGVYIVPYNLIFFPTPIFLISIFLPKFLMPLPLFPTWYSSQQPWFHRKDFISLYFIFFHVIFFPAALIFPSLCTTWCFPKQIRKKIKKKKKLYTPLQFFFITNL